MKKCLLGILLFLSTMILNAGSFTPGNIVALRLGDGSVSLTSAAAAGYLDEYTTSGVLVQSIPFPTADILTNYKITFSGSGTSEDALALSQNGQYLTVGGYYSNIGIATVAGTSGNRIIALITQDGNINSSTQIDGFSTGNIRSAVTSDGLSLWATGSLGGIRYINLGANGGSVQVSASPASARTAYIFNGQLYISVASNPQYGICSIGSGTPVSAGQTTSLLSGFPTSTGPGCYGFSFSPDGNTCYVCDDRATTSGGGLQKWTLSGGTWALTYTLTSGLTVNAGLRQCFVNWTGINPVIYAVTADAYSAGTKIVALTDNGSGSIFSTIVNSTANIAFKGIAGSPISPLPVELTSFSLNTINKSVTLCWKTATEQNSNEFEIERSVPLSDNWKTVQVVKASGNSSAPKQYSYIDKNLNAGKYLYRLKMVDNDGSSKYSNIAETQVALPKNFELNQNYPNPFNPATKISYNILADSKVILDVFSSSGEKVGVIVNEIQPAGYYTVDFNNSVIHKNLASGIYLYRIHVIDNETGKDFSSVKKMILLK